MRLLYTVLIHISGWFIRAAALFDTKLSRWVAGRRHFPVFPEHDQAAPVCWIHCASAGEFEQAIPLVKKFKEKEKMTIVISFFSPSGFDMYSGTEYADFYIYLPIDTPKNARNLIKQINPTIVIFIRNELWINLLTELKKNNIPTFLVNSYYYKRSNIIYMLYLKKAYSLFNKIFEINTYGSTKLDQIFANKTIEFNDHILNDFCKDSFVIIVGSSWAQEEQYIAKYFNKYKNINPSLKIIIAPHENQYINEKDWIINYGEAISYYTNYTEYSKRRILLIDKKGILKYVYRYSNIAIIGGGFGNGTHNILEASIYYIPTIFGPNYLNNEQACDLINIKTAFTVRNYNEFETILNKICNNELYLKYTRKKLKEYFSRQSHVAEKIYNIIKLKYL
ncbi:MAG TPA: glycosyltransferase N-terminal domain-containing protein [Chitinophagales bacterium]|jgi:3-deoxy-D-manno-octulosonic-acid transferase|nr:glycosyltransferase N-terminal domain-containing protein [Chitinophagales bacterium]HQO89279.1 glycosyltransferase N-terminal domain-containing protein [Chitinophagales bacterium]